jgi:hypothetical protein
LTGRGYRRRRGRRRRSGRIGRRDFSLGANRNDFMHCTISERRIPGWLEALQAEQEAETEVAKEGATLEQDLVAEGAIEQHIKWLRLEFIAFVHFIVLEVMGASRPNI